MHPQQFEHAVEAILKRDQRYDLLAFVFLKESLDFTIKQVEDANGGESRHVSGPELCRGFRDLALKQFGPMAATLMQEWGVHSTSDIGNMVFLLIDEQVFGKQDTDSQEDFLDVYDFHETLEKPFLPKTPSLGVAAKKHA